MDSINLEAHLVGSDACSIKDLALSVTEQEFQGVLGLGFTPFICFFAVESYDWIRSRNLANSDPFLEAEATRIRSLRARLKLLGGRGGFNIVLERLQEVENASTRIFHSEHHGVLGWIKHLLQDDLGFYFKGSDLICTTHVGLANVGYFDQQLQAMNKIDSDEIFQFAVNLGSYIANFLTLLDLHCERRLLHKTTLLITAEDYKAGVVYPKINGRLGLTDLPLAASFTWLVSQVNYVHIILRHLLATDSDLFLRFRFLTVYYAFQALRTVGALINGDRTTEIGIMVSEIMSRPNGRKIRRLDKLRDVIAHYGIEGTDISSCRELSFDSLIYSVASIERSVLNQLLDEELEEMSKRFRTIVAKDLLHGSPVNLRE